VNGWGWKVSRLQRGESAGVTWLRAFAAVVPFVTVGLLLLMLHFVGGTLATAQGVLFDLPASGIGDEEVTDAVAMLVPVRHETIVFFDDARYVIGSAASMRSLEDAMKERFARSGNKALLVLADRRIPCGDLMEFSSRARRNGVERVLFAEKKAQEASE